MRTVLFLGSRLGKRDLPRRASVPPILKPSPALLQVVWCEPNLTLPAPGAAEVKGAFLQSYFVAPRSVPALPARIAAPRGSPRMRGGPAAALRRALAGHCKNLEPHYDAAAAIFKKEGCARRPPPPGGPAPPHPPPARPQPRA